MTRFAPDDRWILKLNRYQRDNLLWLLNVCGMGPPESAVPPFILANTGDWIGEIYWMLEGNSPEEFTPNCTADQLRQRVNRWMEDQKQG
jgi:hypothetical protein